MMMTSYYWIEHENRARGQSIATELVYASDNTLQKYKLINRVNYAAIDSARRIDSGAVDLSTS
jgi:hypothetical protein